MIVKYQILEEIDALLEANPTATEIHIPITRNKEFVAAENSKCSCNRERVEYYKGRKVKVYLALEEIKVK